MADNYRIDENHGGEKCGKIESRQHPALILSILDQSITPAITYEEQPPNECPTVTRERDENPLFFLVSLVVSGRRYRWVGRAFEDTSSGR
jgi:hypothetical protein